MYNFLKPRYFKAKNSFPSLRRASKHIAKFLDLILTSIFLPTFYNFFDNKKKVGGEMRNRLK